MEEKDPLERAHPFDIHKCEICAFRTKSLPVILSHTKRHQSEPKFSRFSCESADLERFECPFCYFQSDLKVSLDKHVHLVHEKRYLDSEMELKGFICDRCGFETQSLLVLLRHVCDDPNASAEKLDEYAEKKKLLEHEEKWLECEQCIYKTKSKSALYTHKLRKHRNGKSFKCEHCSFKTDEKSTLKHHTFRKHWGHQDEVKWHECDQCLYKTRMKVDLDKHLIRKHFDPKEIKWLQCEQCSYKASAKDYLQRHILNKHSNEDNGKWFKCEQCCYKSRFTNHLRRHVLCKHLDKDEVNFLKCEQCPFQTRLKENLRLHISRKHMKTNKVSSSIVNSVTVKRNSSNSGELV